GSKGFRRLFDNLVELDAEGLRRRFHRVYSADHAKVLIRAGGAAIANLVYAGQGGNGPTESGDGWRFRTRGYLGSFCRDEYRRLAQITSLPFEQHPDMLAQPSIAANAAAAWWAHHNLNAAADRDYSYGIARLA